MTTTHACPSSFRAVTASATPGSNSNCSARTTPGLPTSLFNTPSRSRSTVHGRGTHCRSRRSRPPRRSPSHRRQCTPPTRNAAPPHQVKPTRVRAVKARPPAHLVVGKKTPDTHGPVHEGRVAAADAVAGALCAGTAAADTDVRTSSATRRAASSSSSAAASAPSSLTTGGSGAAAASATGFVRARAAPCAFWRASATAASSSPRAPRPGAGARACTRYSCAPSGASPRGGGLGPYYSSGRGWL